MIYRTYIKSDQLKETVYHELAHSSHYTLVGSSYWGDLTEAEIAAGGHGDEFSTNAGLIDLTESWAEYIGMSYTDRTYGLNNSLPGVTSWQAELEETRNESLNHIPIGLHYDLLDNSGNEFNVFDDDGLNAGNITDQVAGFTNQQMFFSLNASVTNPTQYMVWLNNHYTTTTGNTVFDVASLFNSY